VQRFWHTVMLKLLDTFQQWSAIFGFI
jgi:hypothetical protein